MKIQIEIVLGNDSMETPADLSESIRTELNKLHQFLPLMKHMDGFIRDGHGNTIGTWWVG